MKFLVISLIAIALALGVTLVQAADDDATYSAWSPVVYPAQRLPLTFSHRAHLARGAGCATCHPSATTSRSAVDNLIPTEQACRACHPIDRAIPTKVVAGAPTAKCVACHPGWTASTPVARVYLTPTPLKFSHAAHAQTGCASCHGDLTKVELATSRQLPTMASCIACHANGTEERHCSDCHLTTLGGLMQTEFAHGSLAPHNTGMGDAHRFGFAQDHRQEARQVGATCGACHDRSECVACHQGVVKPAEFHPGNYVLTHAAPARRGTPDCSACHRAESFCVACHERSGVTQRIESGFASGTNNANPGAAFHPANWASTGGGVSTNRHAGEARRNITACASCHREEQCLECHSNQPGALRATPHPPTWRGSARCKALDRGNRRMCLRCHVSVEELGCDWSAR